MLLVLSAFIRLLIPMSPNPFLGSKSVPQGAAILFKIDERNCVHTGRHQRDNNLVKKAQVDSPFSQIRTKWIVYQPKKVQMDSLPVTKAQMDSPLVISGLNGWSTNQIGPSG